ncbi:M48 family metallopeptidase [Pontiella sulfatireligans]|uniref:Protease HtpX n=1 Tax=Pontiella sulfatireligans TaxID=2750658 RepID=A0A6C2UMT6_9BACT|nr:M48 family metallopeptidase [Pontiella sulfatireligans]VGO21602.1 Protease HtpX [Pontiella sulfatireligans]
MDFFARQDSARKHTGLLIGYFSLAVASTILLVYFIPVFGWYAYRSYNAPPDIRIPLQWWHLELFFEVFGGTLMVVLGGASFKIAQLRRGGGSGVAEMLGGKPILPGTDDFFEKRLRNVVEEMAIASGVPVPPVYVMERERGINAFAAGFAPSDSVVAVTYGTMTGLTRDELQGVIAHEFSHILNNDMRININLMAMLHGLLIIGLTGRIVLELVGRGSVGRRRSKDSGQLGLIILVAGFALMVVGYAGVFFCKLIKASISRSRERLADASAVQFTRNAAGLADALKKIGGLSGGSRIDSPLAEQASHMFFGNALKGSMFSTHPPLAERVQWLEPTFGGQFERVTQEDLRRQLARFEGAPLEAKKDKTDFVDLFTDPGKVVVAAAVLDAAATPAARPNNPEALIASIGAPMEHHAEAAQRLIASIPEKVKEHARDPYGARMLIYFLLLDSDEAVQSKQMAIVEAQAEPEVFQALEKALPKLGSIQPEMRLPIVDLSIPALRFLSKSQYAAFRVVVKALIDADEQTDIFEYALQRVLVHHLDPVFSGSIKPKTANYYAIRGLEKETSVVLSVLARKGHPDDIGAAMAFHAAVEKIADKKAVFQLLEEEHCTWENLDAALDKLNEGSFKVKKWVLGAALACLMYDREITVGETELFRAIADTLGCPVPPWVVPAALS